MNQKTHLRAGNLSPTCNYFLSLAHNIDQQIAACRTIFPSSMHNTFCTADNLLSQLEQQWNDNGCGPGWNVGAGSTCTETVDYSPPW